MNLIKELLTIINRGVIMERMTSKHVISRDDITVILNTIKKEFGLPINTNNQLGLCMLSQVIFSIAATTGLSEDDIGEYVRTISYRTSSSTFNDLGKMVKWFNETPIKIKDKFYQLTLNAHAIKSSQEMMKELKSGQPIICAVPSGGTVDELIEDFGSYQRHKEVPKWALDKYDKEKDMNYEDHDHGKPIGSLKKDLSNGFISKELWAAKLHASDSDDNKDPYAYHSSLCIGYEAGDKAFLFREPRHTYARNGYYKIAASLMTPENIGLNKPLIHGMFYVEVLDMKEVPNPKPIKKDDDPEPIKKDDDDDDNDW